MFQQLLRSLVASPKQTQSSNLDLSFVEPRLIVCAGPVTGFKSLYRHSVPELIGFLDETCFHWHIWNYDDGISGYNNVEIGTRVTHHPFPDHEVPTLDILLTSVNEIDGFLRLDSRDVAVIHCKNGKGRSGTIVCAYLMFRSFLGGQSLGYEDAISQFTKSRMKSFAGHGVSILSQQRYLKYWEAYLAQSRSRGLSWYKSLGWEKSWVGRSRSSTVTSDVILSTYLYGIKVVGPLQDLIGSTIRLQIYGEGKILNLHTFESDPHKTEEKNVLIVPFLPIKIPGNSKDIRICIKGWCYAWFNIDFEKTSLEIDHNLPTMRVFRLTWDEVDGFKGTTIKGSKCFESLEIYWYTET